MLLVLWGMLDSSRLYPSFLVRSLCLVQAYLLAPRVNTACNVECNSISICHYQPRDIAFCKGDTILVRGWNCLPFHAVGSCAVPGGKGNLSLLGMRFARRHCPVHWTTVVAAAAETQSDEAMHIVYQTRQGPSTDGSSQLRVLCLNWGPVLGQWTAQAVWFSLMCTYLKSTGLALLSFGYS